MPLLQHRARARPRQMESGRRRRSPLAALFGVGQRDGVGFGVGEQALAVEGDGVCLRKPYCLASAALVETVATAISSKAWRTGGEGPLLAGCQRASISLQPPPAGAGPALSTRPR